jgi:hypothetical protein
MAMTKKIITKTVVLFVLLILMAAIVITINSSSKNPEFRDDSSLISNNGRSTTQELLVNTKPISDIYSDEMQVFMLNMVNKLREMHGHNIQEVKVQLSLLDFKVFILETYPDNGVALFESIILQAFPLYGDKILGLIASMSEYNKWLKENQLALSELYKLEREGKIFNKRDELFGELSAIIFSDEEDKAQQRQVAIMKTVDMLDQATDISMDERLYLLNSTIKEHFSGVEESLLVDKGLISGIYFNLSSVQRDLKALSESDRQTQINRSREQLGFSKKDIDYLASQDAKKETRWKNGYSYMQKRDSLSDSLSGDELTNELVKLRQKMFKHEAGTIAKEEEQGFYRYERPRLYGKN